MTEIISCRRLEELPTGRRSSTAFGQSFSGVDIEECLVELSCGRVATMWRARAVDYDQTRPVPSMEQYTDLRDTVSAARKDGRQALRSMAART